jgi:hypothetical protein
MLCGILFPETLSFLLQVNNDRSRDYTNPGLPANQQAVLGQPPASGVGGSVLDVSQLSPAGSVGYGGAPYQTAGVAHPPQNDSGAGLSQRPWEYDQSQVGPKGPSVPMGSGPPLLGPGSVPGNLGPPMPGPGQHYRGPPMPPAPGGPAPPGASGGMLANHDGQYSMQGPQPSFSSGPPSHIGPGILPSQGPNPHLGPPPPGHGHPPPPYGHPQQMHPGPQGMPNSGGPPVYYM